VVISAAEDSAMVEVSVEAAVISAAVALPEGGEQ